jgi:hypothetical protein
MPHSHESGLESLAACAASSNVPAQRPADVIWMLALYSSPDRCSRLLGGRLACEHKHLAQRQILAPGRVEIEAEALVQITRKGL